MDERSFWAGLFASVITASVFLLAVALLARGHNVAPGLSSDLFVSSGAWGKAQAYFFHNLQVLLAFSLLLVVCVFACHRPKFWQWQTMGLVAAGTVVALVLLAGRLAEPIAGLAATVQVDPVELLGLLPHGLPEFAALVFPSLYALFSLVFTGRLPGAKAALLCVFSAAVLLMFAAGVEAFVTPSLLGY